ncbi:xylan glycosyltransferase MUCI21-like [Quercus suber]|uniref:xylan glycosyltransferase MUCI21-like n=1 Tax=Quercus suber TaxID=58331 RepID=UPI0032DF3D37
MYKEGFQRMNTAFNVAALGEEGLKCRGNYYTGLYVFLYVFLRKVAEKGRSSAKQMATSRLGHVLLGKIGFTNYLDERSKLPESPDIFFINILIKDISEASYMQVMKRLSLATATCLSFLVFIYVHLSLTAITNLTIFQELNRFRVVFSQSQLEQAGQITCNRSHAYYDLCSVDGPALLEPITSTLYALDPINSTQQPIWLKTRPYPRKWDKGAMSTVKELTLTQGSQYRTGDCTGLVSVFSAGGYTGNFFHDFSDGFVPLFITINSLFYNQDVTLVISDCNDPWWPQKYAEILSQFSHYPIIDIKKERITHCFPSAIIGLIKHGPMIVDPTLLPHHPKSLNDFRVFLENSYKKKGGDDVLITSYNRPQLVFVIRKLDVGRAILNKKEVVKAIEEVGFHVNVLDPTTTHTSLAKVFKLVHSSHAMAKGSVGAIGANWGRFAFEYKF